MDINETLEEYKLVQSTFIGGWFIPDHVSDKLIDFYNNNNHYCKRGNVISGDKHEEDNQTKVSWDLGVSPKNFEEPFYSYRIYLQKCLDEYRKKYPRVELNQHYQITEAYNMQGYPKGGGFKKWHCEVTSTKVMRRVLVFMTYLNDVDDGGTEFLQQNLTTPAKKGLTVIWPAHWTHTHRGQISNTKEKLIVTGWFNYT